MEEKACSKPDTPDNALDNLFDEMEQPLLFEMSTSGSEDSHHPARDVVSLLHLSSGRIISVTYTMPYTLRLREGEPKHSVCIESLPLSSLLLSLLRCW